MITAVDTSVLIAIYKGETDGKPWLDLLQEQSRLGRLLACEVVVAEFSALARSRKETVAFFEDLGITFDALLPEAALLAGETFHLYRKAGGPREHLIPDFLIGAHAQLQAGQIAAADRGYLRRYFSKLRVLKP